MGKLIYEGSGQKWFQENMGRGGAIPLRPRPAPEQESSPEENPIAGSDISFPGKTANTTGSLM